MHTEESKIVTKGSQQGKRTDGFTIESYHTFKEKILVLCKLIEHIKNRQNADKKVKQRGLLEISCNVEYVLTL